MDYCLFCGLQTTSCNPVPTTAAGRRTSRSQRAPATSRIHHLEDTAAPFLGPAPSPGSVHQTRISDRQPPPQKTAMLTDSGTGTYCQPLFRLGTQKKSPPTATMRTRKGRVAGNRTIYRQSLQSLGWQTVRPLSPAAQLHHTSPSEELAPSRAAPTATAPCQNLPANCPYRSRMSTRPCPACAPRRNPRPDRGPPGQ